MSDAKFTPGPWRLVNSSVKGLLDFQHEFQVASVGGSQYGGGTEESRSLNRLVLAADKANAALITAAPELYAACEEISSALDGLVETDEVYPAIAKVREAIRKARGEMTIEKESA